MAICRWSFSATVCAGTNGSIDVNSAEHICVDADFNVAWIDQLCFLRVYELSIFFELLQFHLYLAHLLEKLSFVRLAILSVLAFLLPC